MGAVKYVYAAKVGGGTSGGRFRCVLDVGGVLGNGVAGERGRDTRDGGGELQGAAEAGSLSQYAAVRGVELSGELQLDSAGEDASRGYGAGEAVTVIDRGGKRERVVCLECRAIHTRAKCPKRKRPKGRYQISESTRMQREFMRDALAVQEYLKRRRNA